MATTVGTCQEPHIRAQNPKVAGSNPAPATIETAGQGRFRGTGLLLARARVKPGSNAPSRMDTEPDGLDTEPDGDRAGWASPWHRTLSAVVLDRRSWNLCQHGTGDVLVPRDTDAVVFLDGLVQERARLVPVPWGCSVEEHLSVEAPRFGQL